MENMSNSFTKTIGNKTYIVTVKQSEKAKDTLDKKYRNLCIRKINEIFDYGAFNLEKNLKP